MHFGSGGNREVGPVCMGGGTIEPHAPFADAPRAQITNCHARKKPLCPPMLSSHGSPLWPPPPRSPEGRGDGGWGSPPAAPAVAGGSTGGAPPGRYRCFGLPGGCAPTLVNCCVWSFSRVCSWPLFVNFAAAATIAGGESARGFRVVRERLVAARRGTRAGRVVHQHASRSASLRSCSSTCNAVRP